MQISVCVCGGGVLTTECHRTSAEPSNNGKFRQLMIYFMENLQLNWKKSSSNGNQVPVSTEAFTGQKHGQITAEIKQVFCHQRPVRNQSVSLRGDNHQLGYAHLEESRPTETLGVDGNFNQANKEGSVYDFTDPNNPKLQRPGAAILVPATTGQARPGCSWFWTSVA